MTDSDYLRIKREIYEKLVDHLSLHAATDPWAASLLAELEADAKPSYVLPSGSYLIQEERSDYEVN